MSEVSYRIEGMDCAGCARELETGVGNLPGVETVRVNFITSRLYMVGDVPLTVVQQRVESLGKRLYTDELVASDQPRRSGVVGFWDYLVARPETRLALIGGSIVLITLVLSTLISLPSSLVALAYIAGMSVTLLPIVRSGLNTLRFNREFNINLLMTIAAIGAMVIGEYLEGATVIFLFAIGEALEGYTADRARDSIRGLMALRPATATRVGAQHEEIVPVEALLVDDTIMVHPGDQIPMDGIVMDGMSSVNQAPITGESIPVVKGRDDTVFAGSLNGEGLLTIRVTRLAADNTLSRMMHLVEEAQSGRAPTQRLIDRFAHYYTPSVVVLAAMIAVIPPLLFQQPFYDTATEHGWLYRALTMLVISCPCALVISTPVTIISAITVAAKRGVLIKGGVFLEALGTLRAFAFDKTGTLTSGRPAVTGWQSTTCLKRDTCDTCDDCDAVLMLASAVEQRANHPLARAVVQAAEAHQPHRVIAPAQAVEVLAGRGVRGLVDGQTVTLGSHRLFDEILPHDDTLCAEVEAAEASGHTTMLVAADDRVRGLITLADTVRPSSAGVIAALHHLGATSVMLTGDNLSVAQAVGSAVGVDDVRANLLPDQKVAALRTMLERYERVAMVGDGVNDTPALALATVGIAMGGAGSPQALETADVVLMADDLTQLPFAVRLSRFARHLIIQNVTLSFGLKAVFLGLAVFGITSLWVAILADVVMALLVTLNGMRPLRFESR